MTSSLRLCRRSLHVDLIAVDLGRKLSYRMRDAAVDAALKRGIFFEVCRGALPSLTALSSPPPSATSQFAVGESVIK
jgi:hypothetical protein